MNKQGRMALEVLVILVVMVLASGVTLALVNYGVLKPKEGAAEVSLLNAEFIPFGREGYLAVKEFKFCGAVDERFECVGEGNIFELGDEVYFRFVVESSTVNGEVMLVENYRVRGPGGEVLLEVDEKNNYYFDLKSRKKTEEIYFRDYFTVGRNLEEGKYVLELILENPLLNKKVKNVKDFWIGGPKPEENSIK